MKIDRKKIKWLSFTTVGLLLIAFIVLRNKKDHSKFTYHEDTPTVGVFVEQILSTGTVSPENRLEIKSPVAGRIEKLVVQEGNNVKKGQVLAWISTTERAALIDSARAEGEKELAQWESYYKPTPIYAPIDGMLILKNVEPGQSFSTTDAILVMSDRLAVKAQVDETDIAKVKLGQSAEVVLDAYPNEIMSAKVIHIGFDAKTVNSVTSYIVDVIPLKKNSHMLSGMTANVKFILNSLPDSLMVPSEALGTKDGKACVRIKTGDPKKDERPDCSPVELGPANEVQTVIKSGLKETDKILIQDQKKIEAKNTDSDPKKNPLNPMSGMRKR